MESFHDDWKTGIFKLEMSCPAFVEGAGQYQMSDHYDTLASVSVIERSALLYEEDTVGKQIKMFFTDSQGKKQLRFRINPFVAIFFFMILFWIFLVAKTAVQIVSDKYFPYEGQVLMIQTRWYDHIVFEFSDWEHLVIKTPNGKTIKKLVSLEVRLSNRIQIGDYVIKLKGLGNPVKSRGKKTVQDLLETSQELLNKKGH